MERIFKTPEDSHDAVEIVGVGVVPAYGKGGILVSRVELPELGKVEGKERDEAVKVWAESRGLVVMDAKKAEMDALEPPENELYSVGREAYMKLFPNDQTTVATVVEEVQPAPPQKADLTSSEAKGGSK
jgi:hypothetical protein